jgi:glycosyltransferase involved in cell wall biosynthesis
MVFPYNKQNMSSLISVIIPVRNGSATIGKCLEAVYSSEYENFEVIVVDDNSEDDSVGIIKRHPCKLVRLEKHSGAAEARDRGAFESKGDIVFFTDADCLIKRNALSIVNKVLSEKGIDTVVGGTYTQESYDKGFFSLFQSVFINYSETKRLESPDYIATHAMALRAETFRKSGGFAQNFLPILEDVEFSHRLKKAGHRLVIDPDILVRHIFNYDLVRSLSNAARKSFYWTMYSLKNKDLFADSGTASTELKVNVVSCFISLLFLILWLFFQKLPYLYAMPVIWTINIFINRKLFNAFYRTRGMSFAFLASMYYTLLYPLAVGAGAISGVVKYLLR